MASELVMYIEKMGDVTFGELVQLLQNAVTLSTDKTSASYMIDVEFVKPFYQFFYDGFYRPFGGKIVGLLPSQQIVAHADPPIPHRRRFHIPLQVNEGCWVFHDGDWQQLQVGKIYEMDPTKVHGAVNWGTTVRLHLMVDSL